MNSRQTYLYIERTELFDTIIVVARPAYVRYLTVEHSEEEINRTRTGVTISRFYT